MLFSLVVFLIAILYVVLNIVQSALIVTGKTALVALMQFLVASCWVFLIACIVHNPVYNGLAYACGTSLAMLLSRHINSTVFVNLSKEE